MREPNGERGKEDQMKLFICVEIEMPSTLCEDLQEYGSTLQDVEDELSKEIKNAVDDLLPLDCSVADCYASGWDI